MTLEELSRKSFVISFGNVFSEGEVPGQNVAGESCVKIKSVAPGNPMGVFSWKIAFKIGDIEIEKTLSLN